MSSALTDPILDFYRGAALANGLQLVDVWQWPDAQLEDAHHFIQWLFPLDTPSAVNPDAPLVTESTIRAFAWDDMLRDRMQVSLQVMLRFYGLERLLLPNKKPVIIRARHFDERRGVWLWPNNHNHLRLTRIMRSLRLLGQPRDAEALCVCLEDISRVEGRDVITPETLEHWRDAAGRL